MPSALKAYEEALRSAPGAREQCQARIGLAAVKRITEDLDGAFDELEQAERIAVAHGLTSRRARVHFLRGNLYFPRGDIERCLREHGRSLELARQAGAVELEAAALGGLGDGEFARGRMRSSNERLGACVEVSRRHGFGRIEVANYAQIAHTMLFFARQHEALEEARSAAEAASRVGHYRAELNARGAADFALLIGRDFDGLREEAEKIKVLVDRLGARRFDSFRLFILARAAFEQSRRDEALIIAEQALRTARDTGIAFVGPTVLGVLALALEEPCESRRALNQAEMIIETGCVGANQLRFYPDAIQVALNMDDHDEVERYARALEDFTRPEPLPWSDFFVARGRVLSAFARGDRNAALIAKLQELRDEGQRLGFEIGLPEIRAALAMHPTSA